MRDNGLSLSLTLKPRDEKKPIANETRLGNKLLRRAEGEMIAIVEEPLAQFLCHSS